MWLLLQNCHHPLHMALQSEMLRFVLHASAYEIVWTQSCTILDTLVWEIVQLVQLSSKGVVELGNRSTTGGKADLVCLMTGLCYFVVWNSLLLCYQFSAIRCPHTESRMRIYADVYRRLSAPFLEAESFSCMNSICGLTCNLVPYLILFTSAEPWGRERPWGWSGSCWSSSGHCMWGHLAALHGSFVMACIPARMTAPVHFHFLCYTAES